MTDSGGQARKAAVVGSPIEHSLSPVLHQAAFAALGLSDWTYERIERDAAGLVELVGQLGPDWAGLSITMPGKRAALEIASEASPRAVVVGAANTLVQRGDGTWFADCTDVDGVTGALRHAGGFHAGNRALLLGAGGTAAAALAGFAELDIHEVTLVVREPRRAVQSLATAEKLGLSVHIEQTSQVDFRRAAAEADVVVSTLPAGAVDSHAEDLAQSACLLDVVYHPWPTPLASAVTAAGGKLATGLDMLLHQAFGQAELFTGRTAPVTAMRDALREATGHTLPLADGT